MELLVGDRRIQNPESFPQPFSSFTAAGTLAPPPAPFPISPLDDELAAAAALRGFPPQKLRPIRGNVRSPSSPQIRHEDMLGLQPQPNANAMELDGTFARLGVLANEVCGDGGVYFGLPPDEVDCLGKRGSTVGHGGEGQCSAADGSPGDGSGPGRRNAVANGKGGVFEDESSSSSDDEDSSESAKGGAGSKRKRKKTRQLLEHFVERLTMKVMEKQERLHTQLMEMLERREKESIMREEAWKQQEMERTKRQEAARAQDISLNLAFISFIQNAIGNNGEEIPQAKEGCVSPSEKEYSCDPSSKRWPEAEVQALIMLRTTFEQKFRVMGNSCSLVWDEVSTRMQNMGYHRTGKKCKEKWENMKYYFRRSVENGRKKKCDTGRLPYFNELEHLYKNEVFCSSTASNQTTVENIEGDVKVNLQGT